MKNLVKRLFVEEEGQGLTEYALIIGLVSIVVVTVLTTLGTEIKAVFNDINGDLASR